MEWLFDFKMHVGNDKIALLNKINQFMKRIESKTKVKEEKTEEIEENVFIKTIGSFFAKNTSKKSVEPKALILTPEEEETKKLYEKQLEAILSEECVICGSLYIESVDLPFDSPEEYAWAL